MTGQHPSEPRPCPWSWHDLPCALQRAHTTPHHLVGEQPQFDAVIREQGAQRDRLRAALAPLVPSTKAGRALVKTAWVAAERHTMLEPNFVEDAVRAIEEALYRASVDEVADALVDAFVAGTFVGENDAQTYDQTRHAVYELIGKIEAQGTQGLGSAR